MPGVKHVIVLEGINDIGNARQNPTPTAEDLIAAHKQLIERAHARGISIYGGTLTPFEGAAYFTQAGEAKRQTLAALEIAPTYERAQNLLLKLAEARP